MECKAVQVIPEGERRVQRPLRLGHVRAGAQVVGDGPAVVHVLDGAEVTLAPGERELADVRGPFGVSYEC